MVVPAGSETAGRATEEAVAAAVRLLEDRSRPVDPWIPKSLDVYPVSKARTTKRRGKPVKCWDLRWQVDGWWFSRRFTHPEGTAAQAGEWAKRLNEDFARGWAFDPEARRFVTPTAVPSPASRSVYEWAIEYLERNWKDWEPKTRQPAVRALSRACLHFLAPGVPEPPKNLETSVTALLRSRSSSAEVHGEQVIEASRFLDRWSMPIIDVTWESIEELDEKYRANTRSPGKEVVDSTRRRFQADLRQFFSECSARGGFPDPYRTFHVITKKSRRSANSRVAPVDTDIVLSPTQVKWLAICCAHYGSWGPLVVSFILVMGQCGLRPGEAAALTRHDLKLPKDGPGSITVRRNHRRVAKEWLVDGEDPDWGPLKDRLPTESRRVPIPSELVPLIRLHLELFCPGSGANDLVFARYGKPFDPSDFIDKVWRPGRDAMFPLDAELPADHLPQPKLTRLRPHDLRHAACSFWLQAGVDLKVCQQWSGHRTLSVFLDVYSGVLPGREEEGVAAIERALGQ